MHNITLCLLTTKNIRPGVSSALRIAGCQIEATPQQQSWNHGRSGLSSDKHAPLAKWHVSRSDTVAPAAAGQLDLHNPLLCFSETPQKANPRRQRIFRFRLWSDKKRNEQFMMTWPFFLLSGLDTKRVSPFWQQQKFIQHFISKRAPPPPPPPPTPSRTLAKNTGTLSDFEFL